MVAAEVETVGGVEVEEVVEVVAAKGGGLGATAVMGTSNVFFADIHFGMYGACVCVCVCVRVCVMCKHVHSLAL